MPPLPLDPLAVWLAAHPSAWAGWPSHLTLDAQEGRLLARRIADHAFPVRATVAGVTRAVAELRAAHRVGYCRAHARV